MLLATLVTSTAVLLRSGGPSPQLLPHQPGFNDCSGGRTSVCVSALGSAVGRTVGGMTAEQDDEKVEVAQMFGEVARSLATNEDQQATLTKIVHLAVEHLESCDFAGISMVEGRKITSPASSNDLPKVVDSIQSEVGEGPCLDAIKEHEVFQTGDLAAEERWPKFATRAHEETGVRSILSLRLFVEEATMGALNLYSTKPDAFDDTDVALGSVFAAHAAVAMSAARREETSSARPRAETSSVGPRASSWPARTSTTSRRSSCSAGHRNVSTSS